MPLTNKSIFLLAAACVLMLLMLPPGTAWAENDPVAEPVVSTIADKLIIQLGPEWAGTEFSLTTDMGVYPGVITVNEAGILTTDLGGSTTYTLICLQPTGNSEASEPEAAPARSAQEAVQQSAGTVALEAASDMTPQNTEVDAGPQEQAPASEGTPQAPADEEPSGIPTMHLILFLGGAAICIGGLVVLTMLKRRREYYDEEYDE